MKVASNNINDIREFARKHLQQIYPVTEIDSLFYNLMETYCGMTKTQVLAQTRTTINESELLLVYDAIKELEQNKPIQHIIGTTSFCNMEFKVSKDVLIPRPETEELVNIIINENKSIPNLKILDIGTGSGCIAIALNRHLPGPVVHAMDISEEALVIARQNASMNNANVNFMLADIFTNDDWKDLPPCDIIVSNPPYVLESEKALMHANVLNYEPQTALFVPDSDALRYYKAIFNLADKQSIPTKIYLEINESKAAEFISLAGEHNFSNVTIRKDIHGKDRFFIAQKD